MHPLKLEILKALENLKYPELAQHVVAEFLFFELFFAPHPDPAASLSKDNKTLTIIGDEFLNSIPVVAVTTNLPFGDYYFVMQIEELSPYKTIDFQIGMHTPERTWQWKFMWNGMFVRWHSLDGVNPEMKRTLFGQSS